MTFRKTPPFSPQAADPAGDRSLVLIGGGGHALVVAEGAELARFEIRGFVDDRQDARLGVADGAERAGLRRLGPLMGVVEAIGDSGWILALGDLRIRGEVLARIGGARVKAGARAVVHPAAVISPTAVVGAGAFVGPRAVVNARARIGAHAIVNTGAIVEHECEIGENVHVAPGAVLGGNVIVGQGTLIGIGACAIPGVRIGEGAVVGAGAVVIRDVPSGARVVGAPARGIGEAALSRAR